MLIVFPDTNMLISMFCFSGGTKASLGKDLLMAMENNLLDILVTKTVVEELQKTVQKKKRLIPFASGLHKHVERLGIITTASLDKAEYERVKQICIDPKDVKITASAISLKKTHDYHYLVSNDMVNFHNDQMKNYLAEHGITPLTMFGVLKLLGKR